ncbi:hypothetical protein HMPREF9104_00911 [Lentilactobacillus kisonensis F0435]|uniref:Uncharacterized protein n=1 Tax=Lentilactobacillus kisonensis F0435 TaxID=797516 RepID=H1LE86_9LACO|nr:hypothetical protein HMPREF9104_00911 [Lentilactobacillus kisonensis F0435]
MVSNPFCSINGFFRFNHMSSPLIFNYFYLTLKEKKLQAKLPSNFSFS